MPLVILLSALIGGGVGYWVVRVKRRMGIGPSLWVVLAVLGVLFSGLFGVIRGFELLDGPGIVALGLVVALPAAIGALAGRMIGHWRFRRDDNG